jgi:O-antigen ligase
MENEYARILLELGLPGLLMWALFLVWVFTRPYVRKTDMFYFGRRLAYVASACSFGLGLIGVGLFTSVPATTLTFLLTGWFAVREVKAPPVAPEKGTVPLSAVPAPSGSAG